MKSISEQNILRAPLLDRLIDDEPGASADAVSRRMISGDDLRRSVGRDLLRLLATRNTERYERSSIVGTVLDYGIADFATSRGVLPDNSQPLVREIERALAAFEPRLRHPHVTIGPEPGNRRRLRLVIDATLRVDDFVREVSYQFTLTGRDGSVTLHED